MRYEYVNTRTRTLTHARISMHTRTCLLAPHSLTKRLLSENLDKLRVVAEEAKRAL